MWKQTQKEKKKWSYISFLAIHYSTWMNEERERSPFKHRNLHRLFFFSQLLILIYLLSAEKKAKILNVGHIFLPGVFVSWQKLFFFHFYLFVLLQIFFCRFLVYQNDSLRLPLYKFLFVRRYHCLLKFYIYAGDYIFLSILECADVMHTVFKYNKNNNRASTKIRVSIKNNVWNKLYKD